MQLYNLNQIMRMKINKNEFKIKPTPTTDPSKHVKKVTFPFIPMILSHKAKVYFWLANDFEGQSLLADWSKFELLLFNVIQNAVKYNSYHGVLVIILTVARGSDGQPQVVTQVVDQGEGIEKPRQKLLFRPFMELRATQDFEKVKNRTTGQGLSCSKDIAKVMSGDVELTHSEPGLTVFTARIPVEVSNQPN